MIVVAKNICAIDIPVKTTKIQERDKPITAAKAQKTTCAVPIDIRFIIAERPRTKANGANIIT